MHSLIARPASVSAAGQKRGECNSLFEGALIARHEMPPAETEDRALARMLA